MSLVRSTLSFDPSGWRPVGALLRLLGVALAVLVGGRFGGSGGAVLAGVGALYAGIASFGGVHQARLRRMLVATFAASLATLVGCIVQPSSAATVVTVSLLTFGLGLFSVAGPDASQAALLATGTLIVFSGLHGAREQPLGNALLVLGGGLGQAAILMLVHPISPVAAERRAVETVYVGLARFAAGLAAGRTVTLPPVAPHAVARDLLRAGLAYEDRPELRVLWAEMELADALRGNLAGLQRVRPTKEVWTTIAQWFTDAAEEIARGRTVVRRFPDVECGPEDAPWIRRIDRTIEAEESGRMPIVRPGRNAWMKALTNVEALRTLALGHALRYAVAIGFATFIYRHFAIDHGYWGPLSLAFSLKPDFASTVTRSLGRILGTVAGVTLATALVSSVHPSSNVLFGAMLVAVWIAFALQSASFVGYSAGLAFYVVVSVTLAGASVAMIGTERIWATVAGSTFALVVAIVWPQWESGKVRQTLAVAFAAQAEYADAVQNFEPERAVAYRYQARTTRLEAERIVASVGLEPIWSRRHHLQGAEIALARLTENASRILAAHVAALDPQDDEIRDDLRRLAAEDRGLAADLMG